MINSKTHSKNITLSINSSIYRSLGIDLEFYKKRNPKLINYFKNKNDVYIKEKNLSVIDMWTIKEATFKAISNLGENINFINEVSVNYETNEFFFKNIKGFYKLIQNKKYSLTIAYIT